MEALATMDHAQPAADPVSPADGPDPDLDLLERFRRDGDRAALERLLERHAEAAYRVALRFAGNAADAEDALQDGFIGCMACARGFRGAGSVRSWILAIVANACRRQARAQRRRRRHEGLAPPPPAEPQPTDEGLRAAVLAGLAGLPERYRVPVAMRHLDQLSFADIAAILGTREKSVRTRVGRGLERLRSLLSRRGVAISALAVATALTEASSATPIATIQVVQAAVAKGAALSPAALTLAAKGLGAAWLSTSTIVLMVAGACLLGTGGYGWWSLRPPGAIVLAAEEPGPALAEDPVQVALDQPVTVAIDASLGEAVERLRLAMAPGKRPRITCPNRVLDPFTGMAYDGQVAKRPRQPVRVAVRVEGQPLRVVLDGLCASAGLRWRASRAGIVIDLASDPAELRRREEAFAATGDRASAEALVDADVDGLKPLLLALANDDERARSAAGALGLASTTLFPTWPSPLLAFSDDGQVCAAVALAIARNQQPRETLIEIAGHLRMTRVVDGCIALVRASKPPKTVVERMVGVSPRVALALSAIRALGWIGDARGVDVLLEALAAADAYKYHDEHFRALGRIGDRKAVPALLAFAQDRQAWAPSRGEAIMALAEIGDEQAVQPLGDILLDRQDDDSWVRRSAVRALAWIGGPLAIDLLCRQARRGDGGEEFWVGSEAVSALARLGGSEVDDVLMALLSQQHTGDAAAMALGRRDHPDLVPRLKAILEAKPTELRYGNAVKALGRMRHPSAGQALVDTLPLAVGDRVWYHAQALAGSGIPAAQQALIALMGVDQPTKQRRAVARSLALGGDDAVALALRLIETDPDAEVRRQAIHGFNYQHSDGTNPLPQEVWAGWLGHTDEAVRATATSLLACNEGRFAQDFLVERLGAALRDPSSEVRKSAVADSTGGVFRSRGATLRGAYAALVTDDPDPAIRSLVAKQFFYMVFPSCELSAAEVTAIADRLLVAARRDADPRVRAEAGVCLVKMAGCLADSRRSPTDLAAQRQALEGQLGEEGDQRVRAQIRRALDAGDRYLHVDVEWKASVPVTEPAASSDF